eukprot:332791_1
MSQSTQLSVETSPSNGKNDNIMKMLRKPNEDDDKLSQLVTDTNFFRCVLVQDIPDSYDDIRLCRLFLSYGEIDKLWIHTKNSKNRHGRATVIFKSEEDAEMAEAIMNETEIEDRTLQVHIGVPPSERLKASEKREKQRQERKINKQRENALYFENINNNTDFMNDYMNIPPPPPFGFYGMGRGYPPPPPQAFYRGRGRGRGRQNFF